MVVEDEVVTYDWTENSAAVTLSSGYTLEAKHIILATGYEMPEFVTSNLHRVVSSWCVATEPQPEGALWDERSLIWEATHPYLYARTTHDNRIIVGGEDQMTRNADERERIAPEKIDSIISKMKVLWPSATYSVAHAWSAEFGETEDGLPLIGPVPGVHRILGAYGYGGNGITFSYMASRILAEQIAGNRRPWFDNFAFQRI